MKASELKAGDWFEYKGRLHMLVWCDAEFEKCLVGCREREANDSKIYALTISDRDVTPLPECTGWDWLPPSTPAEPSYADRQAAWVEANGIRVGSKVKIAERAETHQHSWPCGWPPEMDEFVGRTVEVLEVTEEAIRLATYEPTWEYDYYFPYFVLEPIVEPVRDSNIRVETDGDGSAVFVNGQCRAKAKDIFVAMGQLGMALAEIDRLRDVAEARSIVEPVRVREGKWYRRRDGEVVGPAKYDPWSDNDPVPWDVGSGRCYDADGTCGIAEIDLIAEVPEPPFKDNASVRCLRYSPEIDAQGESTDMCHCIEDNDYTIETCVWSPAAGWLVSITGELHRAEDFAEVPEPKAEEDDDLTDEEREEIAAGQVEPDAITRLTNRLAALESYVERDGDRTEERLRRLEAMPKAEEGGYWTSEAYKRRVAEETATPAPPTETPEAKSRSVLRREAAQRGEEPPTFARPSPMAAGEDGEWEKTQDLVLQAARNINAQITGTHLAQMPRECARLIVHLKKHIQDYDAKDGA